MPSCASRSAGRAWPAGAKLQPRRPVASQPRLRRRGESLSAMLQRVWCTHVARCKLVASVFCAACSMHIFRCARVARFLQVHYSDPVATTLETERPLRFRERLACGLTVHATYCLSCRGRPSRRGALAYFFKKRHQNPLTDHPFVTIPEGVMPFF